MAARKEAAMKKAPVVSVEEMKEVNDNLIGGKLTAKNGKIFKLYAYSLPTFDLLKKPNYQDALLSVDLKPVLDSLPMGC